MEIGMFTSGYQRYPLERAFSDAKRLGYDYIELWGGRPHAFAPDLAGGDLRDVLALIDRYQMPVYVYTPEHNAYPFNYMAGSDRQRRDAIEYLKKCIDMGNAICAEYTLISAGHAGNTLSPAEIRTRLISSLKELSAYAEAIGHKLLFEALSPYESNTCTTAGTLAEVLDAVGSPCLFGMCDFVPPFVSNEPILDYMDKLGERMRHLHIIDSDGTSDTHLMPGDGHIPLKELMAELCERHYCGKATVELVTAYLNEPTLYARRALDRVRQLLPDKYDFIKDASHKSISHKSISHKSTSHKSTSIKNTFRLAAAGDNCMDIYDDTGKVYPGGNPVNVAVYTSRLGGIASYIGVVGDDAYGRQMRAAISSKGVDISHLRTDPGNTALTHVKIVDGERVFGDYEEGVMAGFRLTAEDIRFLSRHDLVVSGIWGKIEGDLPKLKALGVPIAFDFADKPDDPVLAAALPYVDYAFFSRDSGSDRELQGFLEQMHQRMYPCGHKIAVVTLGARGSMAYDGSRHYTQGVIACDIADTMGAGDSYIAGFLHGIMSGSNIQESMKIGALSSSVTLQYCGAW